MVSFLLSKEITIENAIKFETRLLENRVTGYTHEQILGAIEWAIGQFLKGESAAEPYLYAVGRLERVLDGKVKDIANKPRNQSKRRKIIRKERVPVWFDEEINENSGSTAKTTSKDQKAKRQEIEDMLRKLELSRKKLVSS